MADLTPLYASIDIGTNSVLLLIAEVYQGTLVTRLEKISEPRIGTGLKQEGKISDASAGRLVESLRNFNMSIFNVGARLVGVAGTHAFREAENTEEVLEKIFRDTKLKVDVLDSGEEARLSYLAIESHYGTSTEICTVDIGGGSTEIVTAAGACSMPLGAVSLSTGLGGRPEDFRKASTTALGKECLPECSGLPLIAVGGTAVTLAMMEAQAAAYNSSALEGASVSLERIRYWIDYLSEAGSSTRSITGLPPSRVDIIVPGLVILEQILAKMGAQEVKVSCRGLRHGLILRHCFSSGVMTSIPSKTLSESRIP